MSFVNSSLRARIQGSWVAVALEFGGDLSTDHIGVDATAEEHRAFTAPPAVP